MSDTCIFFVHTWYCPVRTSTLVYFTGTVETLPRVVSTGTHPAGTQSSLPVLYNGTVCTGTWYRYSSRSSGASTVTVPVPVHTKTRRQASVSFSQFHPPQRSAQRCAPTLIHHQHITTI